MGVMTIESILAVVMLVLGTSIGLSQVRDSINQELNDTSSAIRYINQSFRIPAIQSNNGASVGGSVFVDSTNQSISN